MHEPSLCSLALSGMDEAIERALRRQSAVVPEEPVKPAATVKHDDAEE